MYLVGARFDDQDAAQAAVVELRKRVEVEGDVDLRPLGSVRYEEPAKGLVVAGRFQHSDVDDVVEIMQRHGGEIVFKRPEWRLQRATSRTSERCAGWLSRLRR